VIQSALLGAEYDEQPGFHMSKIHWNTAINQSVSDDLIKELIQHSYELICISLPKKFG
jgi:predicted DNA-binding protein (MmcQ/YjbR family)